MMNIYVGSLRNLDFLCKVSLNRNARGISVVLIKTLFQTTLTLICLSGLLGKGNAQDLHKVALVIGNGTYQHANRLRNPTHDADLIASKLTTVGFSLVGGAAQKDLSLGSFTKALQQFVTQGASADVGIFYYSGHGVQLNGVNYLVPTDSNPHSATDVPVQMVDASALLDALNRANIKLKILILDACRDNPFVTRGLFDNGLADMSRGLSAMTATSGTVIYYATQPGNTAHDGVGDNGPFALALSHNLNVEGLDIYGVFNNTGNEVTDNYPDQQPWLAATAIKGRTFYFVQNQGGETRSLFVQSQFPVDPSDRIRKIFSTGINAGTRSFEFGQSYQAVNKNLDSPFGIPSWESLPQATEFTGRVVRYLWVPLKGLPVVSSVLVANTVYDDQCIDPQSYVVFLFENEKLFSISIRLYKSQTCSSYGRLLNGLFSPDHRSATIHGISGDTSITAHDTPEYSIVDVTRLNDSTIWRD